MREPVRKIIRKRGKITGGDRIVETRTEQREESMWGSIKKIN